MVLDPNPLMQSTPIAAIIAIVIDRIKMGRDLSPRA
jgi:hypothetical protein